MSDRSGQPERHLSSFHTELLRLGAACGAERGWIEEHLRSCATCAAMAAEFAAARGELSGAVAAPSVARLRERLAGRRRRRWSWLGAGVLIPAAATLVAIVSVRRPTLPPTAAAEPEYSVKGSGPELLVAVRRGERVFAVRPGEALRAGDQIRFVLQRVRHPFALIASVDGAGRASVYVPYDGQSSLPVTVGERIEIPGSIIIDESPGPERLFVFLSHHPVDGTTVRAALSKVGARGPQAIRAATILDVGADEQVSMLLEKSPP